MSLNVMALIKMKMATDIELKFKMFAEHDNIDIQMVLTNQSSFPKFCDLFTSLKNKSMFHNRFIEKYFQDTFQPIHDTLR